MGAAAAAPAQASVSMRGASERARIAIGCEPARVCVCVLCVAVCLRRCALVCVSACVHASVHACACAHARARVWAAGLHAFASACVRVCTCVRSTNKTTPSALRHRLSACARRARSGRTSAQRPRVVVGGIRRVRVEVHSAGDTVPEAPGRVVRVLPRVAVELASDTGGARAGSLGVEPAVACRAAGAASVAQRESCAPHNGALAPPGLAARRAGTRAHRHRASLGVKEQARIDASVGRTAACAYAYHTGPPHALAGGPVPFGGLNVGAVAAEPAQASVSVRSAAEHAERERCKPGHRACTKAIQNRTELELPADGHTRARPRSRVHIRGHHRHQLARPLSRTHGSTRKK